MKITVETLRNLKKSGEKIVALTAYDASFAAKVDRAGAEIILVGDSLGMVVQGADNTLSVTVDDMVYHTGLVTAKTSNALVIADMPFLSYSTPAAALENAGRLIKESGACMVKLEGGEEQLATIKALSRANIAVCAHLGLMPQAINKTGTYRVQGRDDKSAGRMLGEAKKLEQAGADLLVLESIPRRLAKNITDSLSIPTIGIGAGPDCGGQVLVLYDLLGITDGKIPKFAKNYLQDSNSIEHALQRFISDVKNLKFPDENHCFH